MPKDDLLAERIHALLKGKRGVQTKRMFGGTCFLLHGNMCCGTVKKKLMVRVGPDQHEKAIAKPHARKMDFTGRSLKGFIYVVPEGIKTAASLRSWVNLGLKFAGSLPKKI